MTRLAAILFCLRTSTSSKRCSRHTSRVLSLAISGFVLGLLDQVIGRKFDRHRGTGFGQGDLLAADFQDCLRLALVIGF